MLTAVVQRWRDRRGTYRPSGETIQTRAFEVARIPGDNEAKAFVLRHHYSASYPAARARYGLYRGDELVGVAVLSHPASQAALAAALPFDCRGRTELGRFVLLDDVPANGESWFLARVYELAREDGFTAVVAHSDPWPRVTDGRTLFLGHIGNIYQATNAVYRGLTPARTWRMFPDGRILSTPAIRKLRNHERGDRHVRELLLSYGAPEPSGDHLSWVRAAVDATTRAFRHRGTHRYLWALDRRVRRHIPAGLAYPKWAA